MIQEGFHSVRETGRPLPPHPGKAQLSLNEVANWHVSGSAFTFIFHRWLSGSFLPLAFGWSAMTSRDGERKQTSPVPLPALPEPGTSCAQGGLIAGGPGEGGAGAGICLCLRAIVFRSGIAAVRESTWLYPNGLDSEGDPRKGGKAVAGRDAFLWGESADSDAHTHYTGPLSPPSSLPRPPFGNHPTLLLRLLFLEEPQAVVGTKHMKYIHARIGGPGHTTEMNNIITNR